MCVHSRSMYVCYPKSNGNRKTQTKDSSDQDILTTWPTYELSCIPRLDLDTTILPYNVHVLYAYMCARVIYIPYSLQMILMAFVQQVSIIILQPSLLHSCILIQKRQCFWEDFPISSSYLTFYNYIMSCQA